MAEQTAALIMGDKTDKLTMVRQMDAQMDKPTMAGQMDAQIIRLITLGQMDALTMGVQIDKQAMLGQMVDLQYDQTVMSIKVRPTI